MPCKNATPIAPPRCKAWLRRALQCAFQTNSSHSPSRAGLAAAHRHLNELDRQLSLEALSPEWLADLEQLVDERGGEWPGWAQGLRQALAESVSRRVAVQEALPEAWLAQPAIFESLPVEA